MGGYNPFSLQGKTVLVTGASSGIGRASAVECSRLGARLVITGRDEQRLGETLASLEGTEHTAVAGDLTDDSFLRQLVGSLPALDGVVLCAGKNAALPIKFCSREKFDDIMNVNFYAPVELLRLCISGKRLKKGASVVFVASIGGISSIAGGNARYGASKAALQSVMKYFALELAPRHIRVNSVNPGTVDTPLIHNGELTEEQLKDYMNDYPMKRFGEAREIALGIVYLLSDASSWTTGQPLVIDGGLTL